MRATHGWTITHVLDTHLHADHLSGAASSPLTTGAALWLNPADPFTFDFEPLVDGKTIELTPGVDLRVASVSVPGHTEGSTMYQLGEYAIFTGDTLFLESVGRPDLADQAEGYAHHLFHSLHDRFFRSVTTFWSFPRTSARALRSHAHEFVARELGTLRHTLPVLEFDEDEFVQWAVANVKDRPGNYRKIVGINAGQSVPRTGRRRARSSDRIVARSPERVAAALRRRCASCQRVNRPLVVVQRSALLRLCLDSALALKVIESRKK